MLEFNMAIEDAEHKRQALRKFMDFAELNPKKWCDRAGITSSTLYSFLSGASDDITYGTLEKLARAVGVTVGVIMGEVPGREPEPQGVKPPLQTTEDSGDQELLALLKSLGPQEKTIVSGMLKSLPNAQTVTKGQNPKKTERAKGKA